MRPAPEVPLLQHIIAEGAWKAWQCRALHDTHAPVMSCATERSPEAHALAQDPTQQDHKRQRKVGAG